MRTVSRTALWIAVGTLTCACFSVDAIPVEDAPECSEATKPDPLVGLWEGEAGRCEFFSNARYTDGCGFSLSGFPSEWARLDDGRYYFGASSLGTPSGECLGVATFSEACDALTLELDCGRNRRSTLVLIRQ